VFAPFASGKGRVFHLGGFSFTGYGYKQRVMQSTTPIGSAFAEVGRHFPAARPGKAAFVTDAASEGHIFAAESGGAALWAARVRDDGSVDEWRRERDRPSGSGNELGDLFASGRTLFLVRGSKVFASDVKSGVLGPFVAQPELPEAQIDVTWGDGHLEGASFGVIGSWIYLTGPKRVFFAELKSSACAP
jgi:hypothetical protein